MQTEKQKLIHSLIFPLFFLMILWLIKISEVVLNKDFSFLGVYPLHFFGLIGIITSPLIHGSFTHLMSNSIPLLVLSVGIFYFYKGIAYPVFFMVYFLEGLWVWFGGRPSYHIGASGLIYGFAAFLFFSGVFRRDRRLMAISLLVTFLYGGLIWGIFPTKENISWEGHLFGMISGIVMAAYYKSFGALPPEPELEDNEEDEFFYLDTTNESVSIRYHYEENKKGI